MANLNVIEAVRFYIRRMIEDCHDNKGNLVEFKFIGLIEKVA